MQSIDPGSRGSWRTREIARRIQDTIHLAHCSRFTQTLPFIPWQDLCQESDGSNAHEQLITATTFSFKNRSMVDPHEGRIDFWSGGALPHPSYESDSRFTWRVPAQPKEFHSLHLTILRLSLEPGYDTLTVSDGNGSQIVILSGNRSNIEVRVNATSLLKGIMSKLAAKERCCYLMLSGSAF